MRLSSRRSGAVLLGCIGFLAGNCALGAVPETQDPAVIRSAIESEFAARGGGPANAPVEVSVGQIDSRLNLPNCPSLQVVLPPTTGAVVSARVSCDLPRWTLYVPVRLHAWVDAVVAATNLAPNRPLAARDLSRARVDQFAGSGGLFTDPAQVEGKILRTGLMAGAPILAPQVELPVTVHRGQKVLLTLRDPGMTIRASAVALEDGRVGDHIPVQNPDSQKTVHATVTREGGVEINF